MTTIAESEVLALLTTSVRTRNSDVLSGVSHQDDASIIQLGDGRDLIITTDFVRGTGFTLYKLGHLTRFDVGYYLIGANVSDLAAMGATPTGVLSVIRYKRDTTVGDFGEFVAGIEGACNDFECTLVGGDSGTYDVDVLCGTAFGFVPRGTALERRHLKPGDSIYLSGRIGRAIAALQYFSQGFVGRLAATLESDLLDSWKRVKPRTALAVTLRDTSCVSACMDVSDGLTASLLQLRRITGCGFRIDGASLPLADSAIAAANALGVDRFELCCGASVDFELLFSVPPEKEGVFERWRVDTGADVTKIGVALPGGQMEFASPSGRVVSSLPGVPWDHQVGSIADVFAKRRD